LPVLSEVEGLPLSLGRSSLRPRLVALAWAFRFFAYRDFGLVPGLSVLSGLSL